ncbi:hypothetical protein HDV02_002824 [Globomyces sp. JEL0801]|nr:hypothetical protein HDV02_002824 [Globomyces sp. JEL0801]
MRLCQQSIQDFVAKLNINERRMIDNWFAKDKHAYFQNLLADKRLVLDVDIKLSKDEMKVVMWFLNSVPISSIQFVTIIGTEYPHATIIELLKAVFEKFGEIKELELHEIGFGLTSTIIKMAEHLNLTSFKYISEERCYINGDDLKSIESLLMVGRLEKLELDGKIPELMLLRLFKSLQSCINSMVYLKITNCSLMSDSNALLAELIRKSKVIQHLNLQKSFIVNSEVLLNSIKSNPFIKSLGLSKCNLQSSTILHLVLDLLKNSNTLSELSIDGIPFNDNQLSQIFTVLKDNSILQRLQIGAEPCYSLKNTTPILVDYLTNNRTLSQLSLRTFYLKNNELIPILKSLSRNTTIETFQFFDWNVADDSLIDGVNDETLIETGMIAIIFLTKFIDELTKSKIILLLKNNITLKSVGPRDEDWNEPRNLYAPLENHQRIENRNQTARDLFKLSRQLLLIYQIPYDIRIMIFEYVCFDMCSFNDYKVLRDILMDKTHIGSFTNPDFLFSARNLIVQCFQIQLSKHKLQLL